MDDKAYKICDVMGGLDTTRLISSNTRGVFQQAIADVELIREFVSQAASIKEDDASKLEEKEPKNLMDTLPGTLQWKKRGYKKKTTSLEGGLGYVDDSPHRIIDRYVSHLNQPLVGDKESDLRLIDSVAALFPWIVDRKSIESQWWTTHQNGRSAGTEKESFLFDTLYTAAWIGTFGDAWAYYPPVRVFGEGHPLNLAEILGVDLNSHELPFVEPNFPKNNPSRKAFLRDPYPDTARPGMSLITAMAPIYFSGTFNGFTYLDTYVASTGVDIAVESVSSLLDVLLDTLTKDSFSILVDANFHTIVISQTVVERIYPERTGFEDERVTYDLVSGEIVSDRRNQTYLVSDTIHQDLTKLTNANWNGLLKEVHQLERGGRDYSVLDITLSGDDYSTEYYAMFERWNVVANWVLLTFAPTDDVEQAIDVSLVTHEHHETVIVKGVQGTVLVAEATIVNNGNLDVTVTAKPPQKWLSIIPIIETKHTVHAGDSLPLQLEISTGDLDVGVSSVSLTFTIQDDGYPNCFYRQGINLPITVVVMPIDCAAATGDRLRIPNVDGVCVCSGIAALEIGGTCISRPFLIACVMVPIMIIFLFAVYLYVERKRELADSMWTIKRDDLIIDDPPEVLGRGTFGLVILAEYRGTDVAVKQVIPPKGIRTETKPLVGVSSIGVRTMRQQSDFDPFSNLRTQVYGAVPHQAHLSTSNDTSGSKEGAGGSTMMRNDMSQGRHLSTRSSTEEDLKSNHKRVRQHIFTSSSGRASSGESNDNYEQLKADFVYEMRLLSKLRHPCITTVMGAVISRWKEPLLVMEYMAHGSLFDLLHNETVVLDGNVLYPILRDISQGLRFLHAATPQVIHGDLKAQNVLVDSKLRAKVADFGLSQKKQVGACGTPFWMAPELLRGESVNTAASDVYSFGIILVETYSRKAPYHDDITIDDFEVLKQVCHPYINKRPTVPRSMPEDIVKLMVDCVDGETTSRPTFRVIDKELKTLGIPDVEPAQTVHSMQAKKANTTGAANLLCEIFPQHIAEALSNGRRVEPEHYDCVTIFFSDIVGFTAISYALTPIKVSDLLDRLYRDFDELSRVHGVFKVETIGDAWMGVTNLASEQYDHTKRIAEFAAGAIHLASKTLVDVRDPNKGYVQIRVGFHCGPVVASVVGSRSPRYSLIGDTVNVASQMESKSGAGRMLCSDRAATLLMEQCPAIPLQYRGKVSVDGKGEMGAFWVNELAHPIEHSNDGKDSVEMLESTERLNDVTIL